MTVCALQQVRNKVAALSSCCVDMDSDSLMDECESIVSFSVEQFVIGEILSAFDIRDYIIPALNGMLDIYAFVHLVLNPRFKHFQWDDVERAITKRKGEIR